MSGARGESVEVWVLVFAGAPALTLSGGEGASCVCPEAAIGSLERLWRAVSGSPGASNVVVVLLSLSLSLLLLCLLTLSAFLFPVA